MANKKFLTVELADGPLAGEKKAAWREENLLAWSRKMGDEWFLDMYYRVGVLKYKHLLTYTGLNPQMPWDGWKLPEDAMKVAPEPPAAVSQP